MFSGLERLLFNFNFSTNAEYKSNPIQTNEAVLKTFHELKFKLTLTKIGQVFTYIAIPASITALFYKKTIISTAFIISTLAIRSLLFCAFKIPDQMVLKNKLNSLLTSDDLKTELPKLILEGLDFREVQIKHQDKNLSLMAYLLLNNQDDSFKFLINLLGKGEKNTYLCNLLEQTTTVEQVKLLEECGLIIDKNSRELLRRFHAKDNRNISTISQNKLKIVEYYRSKGVVDSTYYTKYTGSHQDQQILKALSFINPLTTLDLKPQNSLFDLLAEDKDIGDFDSLFACFHIDKNKFKDCITFDSLKAAFLLQRVEIGTLKPKVIRKLCLSIFGEKRCLSTKAEEFKKIELERQLGFSCFFYNSQDVIFIIPENAGIEVSKSKDKVEIINKNKDVLFTHVFSYANFHLAVKKFSRMNEVDPLKGAEAKIAKIKNFSLGHWAKSIPVCMIAASLFVPIAYPLAIAVIGIVAKEIFKRYAVFYYEKQAALQNELSGLLQKDLECFDETESAVAKQLLSLLDKGLNPADIWIRYIKDDCTQSQPITLLQYCLKKNFYNTFELLISKGSKNNLKQELLNTAAEVTSLQDVKFLASIYLSKKITDLKDEDCAACEDISIYLAFLIKNQTNWFRCGDGSLSPPAVQNIDLEVMKFAKMLISHGVKNKEIQYQKIDFDEELREESISLFKQVSNENLKLLFGWNENFFKGLTIKEIFAHFQLKGFKLTNDLIISLFENSKRFIKFPGYFFADSRVNDKLRELGYYTGYTSDMFILSDHEIALEVTEDDQGEHCKIKKNNKDFFSFMIKLDRHVEFKEDLTPSVVVENQYSLF